MTEKKKQGLDWKVMCTGIIALTAIVMYALSLGHNGWLLASAMTIIGGVIGVTIPNPLRK